MKSIEQRADILIQNLKNSILRFDDMDHVDLGIIKTQIISAIKQQDEITRLECVKNVLALNVNHGRGNHVPVDMAHTEIINTKAT